MDRPEPVTSSRIVETLQRYPAYVIPLATLTAAFLVVDLAFAARLLDTTGGPISEQQLGALEAWGWGLGGVALMLLVWGSFILPRGSRNEWSDAAQRHCLCALRDRFLGNGLPRWSRTDRTARGPGDRDPNDNAPCSFACSQWRGRIDATPITPPAIQSVIISAPYMGFSCDSLPPASRNGLREAMEGMVSRRIGTAEQLYDYVFIPSVRSLRDAYNDYVDRAAAAGGRYPRNSRSAGAGLATLPGPACTGRPVANACPPPRLVTGRCRRRRHGCAGSIWVESG